MTLFRFISIEGVAGAGKSTQVALLESALIHRGYRTYITKAYEGSRKRATTAFMESLEPNLSPMGIMFLFQALHSTQAEEVRRASTTHQYIIADRWRESFFAYHSNYGPLAKLSTSILDVLDNLAFGGIEPTLTILLDASAGTAKGRYEARERDISNVLGSFGSEFFDTTVAHYRKVAKKKGWTIIDGAQSIQQVHSDIKGAVGIQ